jgi:hypothetical protein
VYRSEKRHEARTAARRFEETLSAENRKRLGQFFTGIPLGKILAHIALTADSRTVLDPMAGHGDLLDAAAEAARERGFALNRLDGIEIDQSTAAFCRDRLARTADLAAGAVTVLAGSAFDPAMIGRMPADGYDLAITNPPYVRYQAGGGPAVAARRGLAAIVDQRIPKDERAIWQALVRGYSGLADLSVPSWLLAASMVRPGGTLALVVPATWRSRNYGDVIRYFMLKCFSMRCIVEDTQPGWFSDALVRTHLIIATRLSPQEAAVPLRRRPDAEPAPWLSISPAAADPNSLVGAAFGGKLPEEQLAAFVAGGARNFPPGIGVTAFDSHVEYAALKAKVQQRSWYQELEGDSRDLPLFAAPHASEVAPLPEAVRDLAGGLPLAPLRPLEDTAMHVGQGLRTGCNRFFYVDAVGTDSAGMIRARTSAAFGGREFSVPFDALRPVLRKQAELPMVEERRVPPGRVLDLRRWCLPEDSAAVTEARQTYRRQGEPVPAIMPDEFAAFVREAAQVAPAGEGGKLTPELSAVRTNVRAHRSGSATPRFWYMLPDFMPRHLPAAFVPRIIDGAPWVERNLDDPILIDANFSTFWSSDPLWTGFALKALLNSTWCRLLMEAIGTPMGGGALKLEAAHLRLLPMPRFTDDERRALDEVGRILVREGDTIARADEIVMTALSQGARPKGLASAMAERGERLRDMRRRRAA